MSTQVNTIRRCLHHHPTHQISKLFAALKWPDTKLLLQLPLICHWTIENYRKWAFLHTLRSLKVTCRLNHCCVFTSGARYSGVPQKVFIVAPSLIPSLHRPKSVIFMCPSLSSIRFSSWEKLLLWLNIPKTWCWYKLLNDQTYIYLSETSLLQEFVEK